MPNTDYFIYNVVKCSYSLSPSAALLTLLPCPAQLQVPWQGGHIIIRPLQCVFSLTDSLVDAIPPLEDQADLSCLWETVCRLLSPQESPPGSRCGQIFPDDDRDSKVQFSCLQNQFHLHQQNHLGLVGFQTDPDLKVSTEIIQLVSQMFIIETH